MAPALFCLFCEDSLEKLEVFQKEMVIRFRIAFAFIAVLSLRRLFLEDWRWRPI